MNSKHVLWIFALAALLTACEKNVYVDIPDNDPKVVIFSFLSNKLDTTWVSVGRSVPLYSDYRYEDDLSISNARVSITEDGVEHLLDWHSGAYGQPGLYKLASDKLDFSPGKSFLIQVQARGNTYKHYCTFPEKPLYHSEMLSYDSTKSQWDDTYDYNYYLKFTADNSQQENYYNISLVGYFLSPYIFAVDSTPLYTVDGTSRLLKLQSGESKVLAFHSYGQRMDSIAMAVASLDKSYYLYYTSANKNNDSGGPFSEPVPVYSNVEGALGAIGAINRDRQKIIYRGH